MNAVNFEFDSCLASDFDLMVCSFDGRYSKISTVENGAELVPKTTISNNGVNHLLNTSYKDVAKATFQVCHIPEDGIIRPFDLEEVRDIERWLYKKTFRKFKPMDEPKLESQIMGLSYMGMFTKISFIEINGLIYGLELTFQTDRPFAIGNLISKSKTIVNPETDYFVVQNQSDENGSEYPDEVIITILQAGDLTITNSLEPDKSTIIKGCQSGEVITMKYPMIETSVSTHKIMNDFNWKFIRLNRDNDNLVNKFTFSLPCSIKLSYTPQIKIGIGTVI